MRCQWRIERPGARRLWVGDHATPVWVRYTLRGRFGLLFNNERHGVHDTLGSAQQAGQRLWKLATSGA